MRDTLLDAACSRWIILHIAPCLLDFTMMDFGRTVSRNRITFRPLRRIVEVENALTLFHEKLTPCGNSCPLAILICRVLGRIYLPY